jgi:hypothetical protein
MKAYGGVHVQIHIFLTSALTEGEWSAFTPCERARGTHWIGDRVDDVEKRKFLALPGLELSTLPAPVVSYVICNKL